jgi:hypothetical protein
VALLWPFWPSRDGRHRAGIVLLTEAVLALSVLLVGILAMAVVFTRSRDSEARAVSETRAALFADSVLSGLRAADAQWSEAGTWRENWDNFESGLTNIPLAAHEAWANYTSQVIRVGNSNTVDFKIYRLRTDEETDHVHHSVTYGLLVNVETNDPYDIDRATATLSVLPDRYATRPFVFYTEFLNTEER